MHSLSFHPFTTLVSAARTAHANGCELRLTWNEDKKTCRVEALKVVQELSDFDDEYVPVFLRPQCDPSGGADFEKVVTLRQLGV